MGEVRMIDLGAAEEIERAVSEYRKAVRVPGNRSRPRASPKPRPRLKSCWASWRTGCSANEPPWQNFRVGRSAPMLRCGFYPGAALTLEGGVYALEEHTINYLVSGREVVSSSGGRRPDGPGLVVADPDFDLASPGRRCRRRRRIGGPWWRREGVCRRDLHELAAFARHGGRGRGDSSQPDAFSQSQA